MCFVKVVYYRLIAVTSESSYTLSVHLNKIGILVDHKYKPVQ